MMHFLRLGLEKRRFGGANLSEIQSSQEFVIHFNDFQRSFDVSAHRSWLRVRKNESKKKEDVALNSQVFHRPTASFCLQENQFANFFPASVAELGRDFHDLFYRGKRSP